jgi:uncharacterized membrane protein YkoI
MNKRSLLLCTLGLMLAGTLALVARAQEQRVALDQLPAAVRTVILKEAGGGAIQEIEVETVGGETVYEAEVLREGKKFDIRVAADGTLLGQEVEQEGSTTAGAGEEQERAIKEAEVPPAALEALQKLAGGAKFTEFAEEIEHGRKFYEGSWKNTDGKNVDALVTAAGDLVEMEEEVAAAVVPAVVMTAAKQAAGQDGKVFCEKKTLILYEVKYRQDGKVHEVLYTADGRLVEKSVEPGDGDKDD